MRTCEVCGSTAVGNRGRAICGPCADERRKARGRKYARSQGMYVSMKTCECGRPAVGYKWVRVGIEGNTPVKLVMCAVCLNIERNMVGMAGIEMLPA